MLHCALCRPRNDHSAVGSGLVQHSALYLDDPDVFQVKCLVVLGDCDAGLRRTGRQVLFVAVDLAGDDWDETFLDLRPVRGVVDGEDTELAEDRVHVLPGLLVAADDVARVQACLDQFLGLAQELPREDHHQVGAVARLGLLQLRCHHHQAGRRVVHVQLFHDGRRVSGHEQLLEVVYHHLVQAVGAQRGTSYRRELLARLDVL